MSDTKIEWADKTWNPLLGCERVSSGCDGCYAIQTATIRANNPHPKVAAAFAGLTERRDGRLDWTGRINLLPDRLNQPLNWKKPQRIFVNSQSDLFHKDVPDEYIARVFAVMGMASQHTFQILTKRHGRMRSLLNSPAFRVLVLDQAYLLAVGEIPGVEVPQRVAAEYHRRREAAQRGEVDSALPGWPLPNVHVGVSVEDQKAADLRIPALLDTPAAVRWLSMEPLIGPVDLSPWIGDANGRTAVSRSGSVRGGEGRRVEDRPPGQGMAGGSPTWFPMGVRADGDSMRAAPGGKPGGEVPASASDVRRDAVSRDGAQAGLAALRGADSSGSHGQPQERDLVGQPAGEPGVGHAVGADETRPNGIAARATQPVRNPERHGAADVGAGCGDPGAASGRREAADAGERVRGSVPAHLAHRAGRTSISWIVVGGETGAKSRPMRLAWARTLRDQCTAAGIPFFFKQWGDWVPVSQMSEDTFADWDAAHGCDAVDWDVPQRMGKKRAGRLLDEREWNEFPAGRVAVAA